MYDWLLWLAPAALLFSWIALRSASAANRRLEQIESAARRAEARAEEAAQHARTLQEYVRRLSAGEPVDPEMVEEGRLFDEIDAEEARRILEGADAGQVSVLDVRTEPEVASGHVPGTRWIPLDEIEGRYREVPREGRVLVFCAMGARSADACQYLADRGYRNVTNVRGGMSAWRGPVATGRPS